MKRLKELTVSCTYTVGLTDVEVPDEVYEGFVKAQDECFDEVSEATALRDDAVESAYEWLGENIRERDFMEIEYGIVEMEEADNESDGNQSRTTVS